MKKISRFFILAIKKSVAEILMFFMAYLLWVIFLLITGLLESIELYFQFVIAFLLASLFRNFVWRQWVAKRPLQKYRQILIEFVIFSIILQVFFIFFFPLNSIIPEKFLIKIGFVNDVRNPFCDTDRQYKLVENILGGQVDFSKVKIIQGGEPYIFYWLKRWGIVDNQIFRTAEAFGNTIYFGSTNYKGDESYYRCPEDYAFVHEMVHVWQFQHGRIEMFGFKHIFNYPIYLYTQFYNPDSLYNYGGEIGLKEAKKSGKKFLDFNTEQQAMIIEDMYWFNIGNVWNSNGENFTEEYGELLSYYTKEIIMLPTIVN